MQDSSSHEGQEQHFDAGEDNDQGGDHDRDHRPGADGTTSGDCGGHAADGNTGGQRSRPFLVELEVFACHEVHNCPVEQIGFNDGAQASEDNHASESGSVSSLHAEFATEDNDGDLHEELGTAGVMELFDKARGHVADDDTHNQGHDVTGFSGEAECPRNALLCELGGVGGDVGVGANNVAGNGDEENEGEGSNEFCNIALHQFGANGQAKGHKNIGGKQSLPAFHHAFAGSPEAVKGVVHPHAHLHDPANKIEPCEFSKAEHEEEAAE